MFILLGIKVIIFNETPEKYGYSETEDDEIV
jgi:hypothetical protein